MILILSTDSDTSTSAVMEWLITWKIPVIRLNDNDVFRYPVKIYIEDCKIKFEIQFENRTVSSDEIKVVWFRKFGFFYYYEAFNDIKKNLGLDYYYKVSAEQRKVLNLMTKALNDRQWLCHYNAIGLNKFDVLCKAMKANLKIPYSLITNSKKTLKNDKNLKRKKIISKGSGDLLYINLNEDTLLTTLTCDFTDQIDNIPDQFFPSLIQEKIEKIFELRIFYLDGDFFSMAIFSQQNKVTETDFRNYDRDKPNRWVPYELPDDIRSNLNTLMNDLKLNTGSIDMIYSKQKEYIFLEVNPAGQFGMVSKPCNYSLEKKVAIFLKNKLPRYEIDTTKETLN